MKKYTRLVSGTLAGALAVGMVPAMAMADDSVELLAQTDAENVRDGELVMSNALPADMTFAVGEDKAVLLPLGIDAGIEGSEPYDVSAIYYAQIDATTIGKVAATDDYTIDGQGFAFVGGTPNWIEVKSAADLPDVAGNYVIKAKAQASDGEASCRDVVAFAVVPAAVKGELAIYEVNSQYPASAADTDIVYTGGQLNWSSATLGVSADGVVIPTSQYQVLGIYDAATKLARTDATAAGSYIAEIEFVTGNSTGVVVMVPYEVKKLDLDTAVVTLTDKVVAKSDLATVGIPAVGTINGKVVANGPLADDVTIVAASEILEAKNLEVGNYSVTVGLTAVGIANKNIEDGSKTLSFDVVTNEVTPDFTYAGIDMGTNKTDATIEIDRSAAAYTAASEFDVNKLVVKSGTKTFKAGEYDLVVMKSVPVSLANPTGWAVASVADLTNTNTYGTYMVKAVLNAKALGYAYGGETAAMIVDITNGELEDADVTYTYKGKNVTINEFNADKGGKAFIYSGADFLDNLKVAVEFNNAAVPAADYEVVVEKWNDTLGKYVATTDGVVDKGDYRISVASGKYDTTAEDNAIYVDIIAVDAVAQQADEIDSHLTYTDDYDGYEFLWTGEAIEPIANFWQVKTEYGTTVESGDYVLNAKNEKVAVEVPASAYTVTITKFTPEGADEPVLRKDLPTDFVAAGEYTFEIADADAKDNYDIVAQSGLKLTITAAKVFPDVKSDAWYADEVLVAVQNEWMTGYTNGKFGPNDGMKRGDLALVIARYIDAVDPNQGTPEGTTDSNTPTLITRFADVDGDAYYAWAIKAMDEAGVITGYDNGLYGPEELVTREQLATILARLDASGLGDASILASALDAYVDGDEVAGWATAGVEWAVESGIMGVDTQFLNPGDTVTRAEAAAMIVRYAAL